ncbi:MAG: hypothetical protein KIG58_01400, partial [Bacteroidales bacterium]|nr:hypothetical protein [Bacteroidales bacterium]
YVKRQPGYVQDDYFLIDYEVAVKIVNDVVDTLHYSEQLGNMDALWNRNEMLTILDHLTYDTDGKVYCVLRDTRNASRMRMGHGKYYDAPDDGHTDRPKDLAAERPVLFLFSETGSIEQGWNGTEFIWPMLYTPGNTRSGLFTIDGNKKMKVKTGKVLKLKKLETIDPEEVLSMTMTLGPAMDIILGLQKTESRVIKDTTASLYLQKDDKGYFVYADGVEPNEYYNVHTMLDGEVFPFKLKPVKYLYLRCSRDDFGSKLLIELNQKKLYDLVPEPFSTSDIVYGSDNSARVHENFKRANWTVYYNVKKVLEYKLTEADKETFEQYKQDLIDEGELEG